MAFDLNDEELQATREMNGASKKVMSEEEIVDNIKGMLKAGGTLSAGFDYGEESIIQGLLDLYNKEKQTSHFLQSELDKSNAQLLEEKEKNKELEKKLQDKTYKFLCDNPYIDTFDIREVIMKDEIREIIQDIDNNQPVIAELKLRNLVEKENK